MARVHLQAAQRHQNGENAMKEFRSLLLPMDSLWFCASVPTDCVPLNCARHWRGP